MNDITEWINNLLLYVEPPEGIYNLITLTNAWQLSHFKKFMHHMETVVK